MGFEELYASGNGLIENTHREIREIIILATFVEIKMSKFNDQNREAYRISEIPRVCSMFSSKHLGMPSFPVS